VPKCEAPGLPATLATKNVARMEICPFISQYKTGLFLMCLVSDCLFGS
jgi:hypothetical protein